MKSFREIYEQLQTAAVLNGLESRIQRITFPKCNLKIVIYNPHAAILDTAL